MHFIAARFSAIRFASPLVALLGSLVLAPALALALAGPALAQSATRTRLLASPSPSNVGQTVMLTAEIDGLGGGAPAGLAAFSAGATELGVALLRTAGAGQATIATGFWHSCALSAAGGVQCWGANFYGQIGDGTTMSRPIPVPVAGLANDVIAVASGGYHTCALTSAGAVRCWGRNIWGQLGDGTTTDRSAPVPVSGLTLDVIAISAGFAHSCALTRFGAVKCWGANHRGQLGDGTLIDRTAPVAVSTLGSGVIAIAAGGVHSCAVTGAGAAKCWGRNIWGQLGDGTLIDRTTPVAVRTLGSGVIAIAAGDEHSCAVTGAGGVKCWGRNHWGQLGDGTTTFRLAPVDVSGLASGVSAIAAGGYNSCALTDDGGAKCWGDNDFGQIGDGSFVDRYRPVDVRGLASGVAAIAVGDAHVCAMTGAGGVKCWGTSGFGGLGDGTGGGVRVVPVAVSGLGSGTATIAAGDYHACALTEGGAAKCWGSGYYGQIGDGNRNDLVRYEPAAVSGLASGVVAIAAGGRHSCAVTNAGAVKCWGYNIFGQIGDGTQKRRLAPVDVGGLSSGIVGLALGYGHSCALDSAGAVACWGRNSSGELGDGTTLDRLRPAPVSGLAGVVAIAAGHAHSCALTSAGAVLCWGRNSDGQLGDGTIDQRLTPVPVSGLSGGVVAISAGAFHTCALTGAGAVKCWGHNSDGQLGDGTTTRRLTPVTVPGPANRIAIAAGGGHTCAVASNGFGSCWGRNAFSQLGDRTSTNQPTPVGVKGLGSVAKIAAGREYTCALTAVGGGARCWGSSSQTGDGNKQLRPTPVVTRGLLALVRSAARLPTAVLGLGVHTLGAAYDGDAAHLGSSGATRHRVR